MGFASRSSATWGRFQTPPVCKCEKPIAASKLTVCSYPQSHHAFVRVALLVFVLVDFCGRESSSFSAPWHHLCCAGFLGNANSAIKMPRIMTALHLIQRCRKCAAPSAVHYFFFFTTGVFPVRFHLCPYSQCQHCFSCPKLRLYPWPKFDATLGFPGEGPSEDSFWKLICANIGSLNTNLHWRSWQAQTLCLQETRIGKKTAFGMPRKQLKLKASSCSMGSYSRVCCLVMV